MSKRTILTLALGLATCTPIAVALMPEQNSLSQREQYTQTYNQSLAQRVWNITYHYPDTILEDGKRARDASTPEYNLSLFADSGSLTTIHSANGEQSMYLNKEMDETLDQVIKSTETTNKLLQAVVNGNAKLDIQVEAPEMLQAYWIDPSRFIQVLRRQGEKVLISENQGEIFYAVLPQDGAEDVELELEREKYHNFLRRAEEDFIAREVRSR